MQNALQDAKISFTENYSDIQDDPFKNIKNHGQQRAQAMSPTTFDDNFNDCTRKSARRGKGNRYQEFMNHSLKKSKTKPSSFVQSHKSSNSFKAESAEDKMEIQNDELTNVTETQISNKSESGEFQEIRKYDATNFNLDDKIMALPGLDLEEYLIKKKESKKKKKFSSKFCSNFIRNTPLNFPLLSDKPKNRPHVINKHIEITEQQPIVGSQKRKARKNFLKPRRINSLKMEFELDTKESDNMQLESPSSTVTTASSAIPDLFGLGECLWMTF